LRVAASANKPVALWSVPRSISTAFERVFVERDDFEVLHEPFSTAYYHSEDRLSARFTDEGQEAQNSYQDVLAEVFRPREKRLFLKDMAYHVKPLISSPFVSNFVNTFIIRDPKCVLSSLYKMWPDFTLEETGFEQIYNLFRYATEVNGEDVVVVDAMNDLLGEPRGRPRRLLRAPGRSVQPRLPLVGVEGGAEVGHLGRVARGGAAEHRHRARRAQRPGPP
jgi:hypothetical protein